MGLTKKLPEYILAGTLKKEPAYDERDLSS
jgi:hypothetical protein